jgi:hypothetical protein
MLDNAQERARPRRWPLVAACLLLHSVLALAQSDQLELNALVQEGDLILEEAAALAPVSERLAQEGKQMAASDKALRAEAKALDEGIADYNARMTQLNDGVKEMLEQCPQQSEDQALVESCNARGTQLRALQFKLDEDRPAIQARQKTLNERIDKHNADNLAYSKRRQENDQREMVHHHDAEDWLGRARSFLSSEGFATFLNAADPPAACSAQRIAEVGTLASLPAMKRAQECLKAAKAASR